MTRFLLPLFLLSSALLNGCAHQGLYDWGRYEHDLYTAYKDPAQTEALRARLEEHIGALEASGAKVAPGLYAELGTLYLQANRTDQAIAWYAKEQATWPESRGLMSTLIARLGKRDNAAKETEQ
ncbi:MAG: DUF4810 domain-containing protein [Pseudomonadota bacterium]